MIHKSALRCQRIVQSLLSFARRHQPERKLSSLNELVEGAVEILVYQMRTSNIEVTTRLHPELPKAMVDPHQVQQVFLNLINNARQAIEAHRPSGWVRITTEPSSPSALLPLAASVWTVREGVGKKVLVIDDEEPILHMVREALTEHGYEVDFAQDGETALQRLDQVPYDLTLCDWKMPGLNGQQVYERLRLSNPAIEQRLFTPSLTMF